jgi:hypothetical protein
MSCSLQKLLRFEKIIECQSLVVFFLGFLFSMEKTIMAKILITSYYSARRLMGSRIIESAAYCNQIMITSSYLKKAKEEEDYLKPY